MMNDQRLQGNGHIDVPENIPSIADLLMEQAKLNAKFNIIMSTDNLSDIPLPKKILLHVFEKVHTN